MARLLLAVWLMLAVCTLCGCEAATREARRDLCVPAGWFERCDGSDEVSVQDHGTQAWVIAASALLFAALVVGGVWLAARGVPG